MALLKRAVTQVLVVAGPCTHHVAVYDAVKDRARHSNLEVEMTEPKDDEIQNDKILNVQVTGDDVVASYHLLCMDLCETIGQLRLTVKDLLDRQEQSKSPTGAATKPPSSGSGPHRAVQDDEIGMPDFLIKKGIPKK